MKNIAFLLILLPALMLAGCALVGGDDDDGGEMTEAAQNRRAWERLGFDTYEYDLNIACFCPFIGPVRVLVRADTVHSVTVLQPNAPPSDLSAYFVTIDDLFDIVEDAEREGAFRLDVTYDDSLRYPRSISIDYIENAVDDEINYTTENLHPLR